MSTEALNRLLKDNPALYKALMAQVACEKSLYKFTQTMWEFVEPANPFIGGWVIQVMCDHLEAVTRGEIKRLLINVPPGFMKSMLTDVMWPAWEWIDNPHMRYVCTSYSAGLTERDNGRFRQVITSDLYKAMWGDRFKLTRDSVIKIENDKTGWKLATSTEGLGTGERGNRVICVFFDTMILSSDGWLKIGDIVEKRLPVKIAGWNGKHILWQDIDAYEKNPFRQLIELDFGDGILRCTKDHLIFTSKGYVAAKDIICGDEVWSFGMETMLRVRPHDTGQAVQNKKSEILPEEMQDHCGKKNGDNGEKILVKKIVRNVNSSSIKDEATYNLRVGSCRNYFADGILVHNCDDPHNVKDGESDAVRKSTLQYFTEVLPTRVTDPIKSAFVVIMQRVHEDDVSGLIISKDLGYDHLILPMEFEVGYPLIPTSIGFTDPRTEPGQLLFPERFPEEVVERDKKVMGPYAINGQFQQRPVPRGGGIIKRDYWKVWPEDGDDGEQKVEYPVMDFIIASIDTAFRKDGDGDFNALAILGVWRKAGIPKIMLMHSWQKRLDFRGIPCPPLPGEGKSDHLRRAKKTWGMLEWTAYECKRFGVDKLLIEDKATGITLSQEIRKVYMNELWSTQLVTPRGDKVARAYSVQHLFAEGMIYAPERDWADEMITQAEKFPKGAHDDLVDSCVQGIKFLRDSGLILRRDDVKNEDKEKTKYRSSKPSPLYPV